jgi:hypothetical protein
MQPGTQDFLRHSSLILALFFNKVADEKRATSFHGCTSRQAYREQYESGKKRTSAFH